MFTHSTQNAGTHLPALAESNEFSGMFTKGSAVAARLVLLAVVGASSIFVSTALAQSTPSAQGNGKPATQTATPAVTGTPAHYKPNRFSKRASEYYGLVWGVDSLDVKWTESGEVIRFSYRVLDADKAKILNDKKNEPSLVDPQAGVKLVVPSLEKVGQLRQSAPPEAGKVYWMAFSNKGRFVKRGDRVSVVIGTFRADGLVVN
jgi:hypothetical protein